MRDDQFMLLGVAFGWGKRKGLDVFIELAKRLPEQYRIVWVGTDDNIDTLLPKNVISIHRTENQKQLAEIYTVADVYVNPTREEVLGMTNIEALACGTPIITYNTGGSPEAIDDTCGWIIEKGNINEVAERIKDMKEKKTYQNNALNRSKFFDRRSKYMDYISLYQITTEKVNEVRG